MFHGFSVQKYLYGRVLVADTPIYAAGHEPNTDIGPVISPQSKERIHRLIQSAVDQGAELLLDGRDAKVRGLLGVKYGTYLPSGTAYM